MSERVYQPMTDAEVVGVQEDWVKCLVDQDVEGLLALYDFGNAEKPLLFKPTLANVIRIDEEGTRSYFVGGNPKYPHDVGFALMGWTRVELNSAAGPIPKAGGLGYIDMGHKTLYRADGSVTRADYTFAYHKVEGKVKISLHHSSLTWEPAS